MKKDFSGQLVFSPSDLVRYLASPFASWMDRYSLENPGPSPRMKRPRMNVLLRRPGNSTSAQCLPNSHRPVSTWSNSTNDPVVARAQTLSAISAKVPIIYQAALADGLFAGFADFLLLDESGRYQVWDTKLAYSPKPHYAIQLCCYSEMLAAHDRHSDARHIRAYPRQQRKIVVSHRGLPTLLPPYQSRFSCHAERLHRKPYGSPGTPSTSGPWLLDFPCREVLSGHRPPGAGRGNYRGPD